MKFKDIPQFTRSANYAVDVGWDFIETQLSHWNDPSDKPQARINLDPDFQRTHVWTEDQQRRYVEFILRGGHSSKDIQFNCTGWMGSFEGPFVLVDGKQRLEAARKFMRNELPIFDGNYFKDFEDRLRITSASFRFHVNNLKNHREVLQWYLDLNTGGTPHTNDEIEKVKEMLKNI